MPFMTSHRTKITDGGRLVIPAELRRELGLQPGSEVVLDIADGELRIRSVHQAIKRAQSLVRRYVEPGASLADELIADRREAARFE
jgi:AbrB family looped-hinge helix DNA binding protein